MGIEARQIVREGKKMGYDFERGSYATCAIGYLSMRTNTERYERDTIAEKLGIKPPVNISGNDVLWAVETGFEDSSKKGVAGATYEDNPYLRRYYKVGRNIAKRAGLEFN